MKYSIQKQTKTTYEFPLPPEGEEWHNPEGASAEEVGEGYRLLTKHERRLISDGKLNLGKISVFLPDRTPRIFDAPENTSSGIPQYTYRVPDTTPVTPSRLQYNSEKFYGYSRENGSRRMLRVNKHDSFIVTLNPCSMNTESVGVDSFEGWRDYGERNGCEIKQFDSLLELAKWMAL